MSLKSTGAKGHAIIDLDNRHAHAELGVYDDDSGSRFKIYVGGLSGTHSATPRFEIDKNANVFVKGNLCINNDCRSKWPSASGRRLGERERKVLDELRTAVDALQRTVEAQAQLIKDLQTAA